MKNGVRYMEKNSQIEILEAQIRECYGRVVWSHKVHEKCADIFNKKDSLFKISQIILSAITTSGIIISITEITPIDNKLVGIFSGIMSALLLILNTYLKKYDLGGFAQKHANTANLLWNVREKYLSLITDIRAELLEEKSIRETRDKLQQELTSIYKGSPRSFEKAYKKASEALNKGKEMTFSPEEIDLYLPEAIRACPKNSATT
jgi:hypothetical protein